MSSADDYATVQGLDEDNDHSIQLSATDTEDDASDVDDSSQSTAGIPYTVPRTPGTASGTVAPPIAPLMGDCRQVSAKKFEIWVGGKPKADWSGLHSSATYEYPGQHRPIYAHHASKAKAARLEAPDPNPKFKKGSDIGQFAKDFLKLLEQRGLDTVTYLPDPLDPSKMLSVITDYPRFDQDLVVSQSKLIVNKWDKMDRHNDEEVTELLLKVLHPDLAADLKKKTDGKKCVVVWMKMIQKTQDVSINDVNTLRAEIKKLRLVNYSGQNVELLTTAFTTIAKKLDAKKQYDNLDTLTYLNQALSAGDPTDKNLAIYRTELTALKAKLEKALAKFPYQKDGIEYLRNLNLTYSDVADAVDQAYLTRLGQNEWTPALNPSDARGPPRGFGANVAATGNGSDNLIGSVTLPCGTTLSDVSPSVLKAMLVQVPPGEKNIKCFNCGKTGHYKRNCPQLPSGTRSSPGNRQNTGKTPRHSEKPTSWRRLPPKDGEPSTKEHNGRTFNWCDKCKRWTTTHDTSTHKKKTPEDAAAHHAAFPLLADPGAWFCSVIPDSSNHQPAPSTKLLSTFTTCPKPSYSVSPILISLLALGFSIISLLLSVSQIRHMLPSFATFGTTLFNSVKWFWSTLINFCSQNVLLSLAIFGWLVLFGILVGLAINLSRYQGVHSDKRTKTNKGDTLPPQLGHLPRHQRRYFQHRQRVHARRAKGRPQYYNSERRPRNARPYVHSRPPTVEEQRARRFVHAVTDRAANLQAKVRHYRTPQPPPRQSSHREGECSYRDVTSKRFNLRPRRRPFRTTEDPNAVSDYFRRHKPRGKARNKYSPRFYRPAGDHRFTAPQKHAIKQVLGNIQFEHACVAQSQPGQASHPYTASAFYRLGINSEGTQQQRCFMSNSKETHFDVIWDTGASLSISPCKDDFVGPIEKVTFSNKISGIGSGVRIAGRGYVRWCFIDAHGSLRALKLPAYYVPNSKDNLLVGLSSSRSVRFPISR